MKIEALHSKDRVYEPISTSNGGPSIEFYCSGRICTNLTNGPSRDALSNNTLPDILQHLDNLFDLGRRTNGRKVICSITSRGLEMRQDQKESQMALIWVRS